MELPTRVGTRVRSCSSSVDLSCVIPILWTCRNTRKLEQAKRTILEACSRHVSHTNHRGIKEQPRIYTVHAEYDDLSQVKAMCHEVDNLVDGQMYSSINVLINNAGVYTEDYCVTKDGYEVTYQTNVLASHIVTSMLWKRVSERIINVASVSSSSSSLTSPADYASRYGDQGGRTTQYNGHRAYSDSKLLNIVQTMAQDRFIRSLGHGKDTATIHCLDPGTVNTKMLLAGWGPIGIDVSDANDETYLATSMDPIVSQSSGQYFVGRRVSRPPPLSLDPAMHELCLEMCQRQTGVSLTI